MPATFFFYQKLGLGTPHNRQALTGSHFRSQVQLGNEIIMLMAEMAGCASLSRTTMFAVHKFVDLSIAFPLNHELCTLN